MGFLAGLLVVMGVSAAVAPAVAVAQALAVPPTVTPDDPHQHGVATLEVRVAAGFVRLRLRAPLDSLVGFEQAPRNARQRRLVREMAARLRQPQFLFVPTDAAECLPDEIDLASEVIAAPLLADEPPAEPAAAPRAGRPGAAAPGEPVVAADPGAPNGARNHADLDATISFACARPQALTGLQVRIFDAFPGLRQIDVAIETPQGQSGARLSPSRIGLTW
jgi:hypothetical protein